MAPADTAPLTRPGWPLVTATVAVTAGAIYATAHGLYEVAVSAGQSPPVALVYPLIVDGLALVAYGATRRLTDAGRRYAWCVVCGAASLSGVAQGAVLAGSGAVPSWLRFAVGAVPVVAAVSAAHLLYLVWRRPSALPATVVGAGGVSAPPPVPRAAPKPAVSKTPAAGGKRADVIAAVTHLEADGLTRNAAVKQAAADHGLSARTVFRYLETTDTAPLAAVRDLRST